MVSCEVCGADVEIFDEKGGTDDYRWYICHTCGYIERKQRLNIDKILEGPEKAR